MKTSDTKYGVLTNIVFDEYYANGTLKRCILVQKNTINIPCGFFTPFYKDDGKRKNLTKSVTFYENGNISGLLLQEPTYVKTKLGSFLAEMITFYESGEVKRIFPSFGSINAFWTEKDEYLFSPELQLELPFGTFKGKVINLTFYETGELKSITLWPKDTISIMTPAGKIQTRIGFCLYPNGTIKSVEPSGIVDVNTPIGMVTAFDPDALGIDGESNSLVFTEDGKVKSIITSDAQITVYYNDKEESVQTPSFIKSYYFDNKLSVVPMKISFLNGNVQFGKHKTLISDTKYKISDCSFKIETFDAKDCCNSCDECSQIMQ